jgi:hypothetical protein
MGGDERDMIRRKGWSNAVALYVGEVGGGSSDKGLERGRVVGLGKGSSS